MSYYVVLFTLLCYCVCVCVMCSPVDVLLYWLILASVECALIKYLPMSICGR